MLADMSGNNLLVLGTRVSQNPLDQVVAVLVTCDINEGDSRAIHTALTHAIEISIKELRSSNFEALLNYLGGKLVRTIFCRVSDNVVNSPTTVGGSSMLADVLNTPIAKLAVSDDVNVGKNLFDAWALVSG